MDANVAFSRDGAGAICIDMSSSTRKPVLYCIYSTSVIYKVGRERRMRIVMKMRKERERDWEREAGFVSDRQM